MNEEWLIGPGTQEAKESWHAVTHTTLADYSGSKPYAPRPHLLSRPKKNTCFLLCSLSRYEDWYATPAKKKKSFPWPCHPVCASPATCFKPILFPLSPPELSARNDTLSIWHSKNKLKKKVNGEKKHLHTA